MPRAPKINLYWCKNCRDITEHKTHDYVWLYCHCGLKKRAPAYDKTIEAELSATIPLSRRHGLDV